MLASGDGSLSTSGDLSDGRPRPTEFAARTTTDDDTLDVKLAFENGNVMELTASAPEPHPDRVELTDAHRQGILDPLTALLIPAAGGDDGLTEAACQRTLPVFDGRRRFDLKLAFKRMDKVKADKGYAGPAVVCAVTFQPIAGHRSVELDGQISRRRPRHRDRVRAGRRHAGCWRRSACRSPTCSAIWWCRPPASK